MKKLAIWGAGGTGIQIIEIAQWQNEEEHLWDEIFFVDNWKPEDEEIYGARNLHFGTVKELFSPDQVEFVIALGEPRDRKLRFEEIRAAGYGFGKACFWKGASLRQPLAFRKAQRSEKGLLRSMVLLSNLYQLLVMVSWLVIMQLLDMAARLAIIAMWGRLQTSVGTTFLVTKYFLGCIARPSRASRLETIQSLVWVESF